MINFKVITLERLSNMRDPLKRPAGIYQSVQVETEKVSDEAMEQFLRGILVDGEGFIKAEYKDTLPMSFAMTKPINSFHLGHIPIYQFTLDGCRYGIALQELRKRIDQMLTMLVDNREKTGEYSVEVLTDTGNPTIVKLKEHAFCLFIIEILEYFCIVDKTKSRKDVVIDMYLRSKASSTKPIVREMARIFLDMPIEETVDLKHVDDIYPIMDLLLAYDTTLAKKRILLKEVGLQTGPLFCNINENFMFIYTLCYLRRLYLGEGWSCRGKARLIKSTLNSLYPHRALKSF